jgi:excisionase family DNA binding protein
MNELTTAEAAALLDLKYETVRRYINIGKIKAEKHGRDWFITVDEVARYRRTRRKPGRPAAATPKETQP